LEHLTIHLQKQSKVLGEIQYQWPDGSDGAPCLKIIPPAAGKKKRFQVCLIVAMETIEWIPSLRLVPNRNNDKHSSRASDMFAGQRYNQSLLDDVRHVYQDDHLAEFLDLSKEVGHTLVLIQVWALQRGLWRNHDGIRAEAMALFVIYLLRTHQMNARMTSIQLLTVVLQALVKINWLGDSSSDQDASTQVRAAFSQGATSVMPGKGRRRDVLVLPLQDETVEGTISESSLAKLYAQQTEESPLTKDDPRNLVDLYADTDSYGLGPVFLDPTMSYNYFGNVSPNYMTLLRSHAAKSLNMIQSRYAFSHLFLRPVRFWSHWDMYIRIPVNKKNKCTWEESIRCLTHTLEVALGNRIRGLRILSTGNGRVETDADEVPHGANIHAINTSHCPIGNSFIVIGVSINPETSQRAVDRGPPSDDVEQGAAFLKLWGKKAQLRRFKDGAIIQAVVWNDTPSTFCNEDRMDGGIVKKIIQHIVELHYSTERIDFALPELLSTVDGVAVHDREAALFSDSFAAQRNVMKAFEALSDFLRTNSQAPYTDSKESSRLGLPLPIDAVEPLSPCLRYSELFPPLPHPLLGGEESAAGKKVPGAVTSDPIKIQLRFGASSKWPTDLKAMGAAKAAMLVQLINGIEELDAEGFDGPMIVTPTYADIGFKGYCFRIIIRADQEIKMLESLQNPSPEASTLLASLIKKHRIASSHHAIVHGVNSLHPSAGAVVRMAKRWIDCHMFSSHFPIELIELLVAKVYTDNESPAGSPCTAAAGFLRFLALISTHNWAR
jgi:U3 small nucleolar RNA-associated protein 22